MSYAPLILASASPRRHELLARLGVEFEVIPCPLPEPQFRSAHTAPIAWAQALAFFKARAVAERHPQRWVLGADTIVACAGEILGKPQDEADARRMLEIQAREPGTVITGVCLLRAGCPPQRRTQAARTEVWMRDDPALRAEYLASGDWAGKAGAYGIQSVGDRLVERIDGSFSNVVGLPLNMAAALLRWAGWNAADVEPADGG